MLTAKADDMDKLLGFEHGADDYLTKPFNILELKARIRALLRRGRARSEAAGQPEQQASSAGTLRSTAARARALNDEDMPVDLTAKEFDLMELLMRNPNRVYSRETLLDAIWGYDISSDIRTVDVHIRRLREKLERNPAAAGAYSDQVGSGLLFQVLNGASAAVCRPARSCATRWRTWSSRSLVLVFLNIYSARATRES